MNPDLTPEHKPPEQPNVSQPDSATDPASQEQPLTEKAIKTKSLLRRVIASIFSWVVIPILIVLFVHNFIFQAFYVSGTSMVPTFNDGDYLVISKIDMTMNNIKRMVGITGSIDAKRGDVIVFRYPASPQTFFVKRVIGLPGERVVVNDGKVTIYNKEHPQGLILGEEYIEPGVVTQGRVDTVVEKDKFFVMGDNRTPGGSYDSRDWGTLPQYDIIGRAELRLLPVNHFGIVADPKY